MSVIRHRARLSAWWCDECRAVVADGEAHAHYTRRVELIEPDATDAGAVSAAELARIELDTALSRVGKSDHDVRLSIERARRHLGGQ